MENFDLPTEEALKRCKDVFKKNEKGVRWQIDCSRAKDERHWIDSSEEERVIEAPTAAEALLIFMKDESGYEIWCGVPIWEWGGEWKSGAPRGCPKSISDWYWDDGCDDGDVFHWKIYTVKKLA